MKKVLEEKESDDEDEEEDSKASIQNGKIIFHIHLLLFIFC